MKLRKLLVATNIIILLLLICTHSTKAQYHIDTGYVDTVAVKVRAGFTAEDFIRMTKEDTSFHRAFKNLKMFPHESLSDVEVFNKKWTPIGKLQRTAQHFSDGTQGWITVLSETTDGKIYKRNGKHKYFTAEMYDRVFFATDTFGVSNTVGQSYDQESLKDLSTIDKYYEKLKTFMFSPGTKVEGVPLIGKKLDIFSEKMRPYYDFKVEKTFFKDSIPCYKFSCTKKQDVKNNKVVITKLTTFYDRRTFQIIARSYALQDVTALFSFDIKMYIELNYLFGEYLPKKIKYNGEWDVPFGKPERLKFTMTARQYQKP